MNALGLDLLPENCIWVFWVSIFVDSLTWPKELVRVTNGHATCINLVVYPSKHFNCLSTDKGGIFPTKWSHQELWNTTGNVLLSLRTFRLPHACRHKGEQMLVGFCGCPLISGPSPPCTNPNPKTSQIRRNKAPHNKSRTIGHGWAIHIRIVHWSLINKNPLH